MRHRIVIIGGVAGGMSAATRLRRLDEAAEIVVLERGGYVSFANCGLPYYLGGVIEERSSLLLQSPAGLGARFGLDVRVRSEAIAIDPAARRVRVRSLGDAPRQPGGEEPAAEAAEYDLEYDRLILAPGAAPRVPELPGLLVPLLSLRDMADTDAIDAALDAALAAGRLRADLAHRGEGEAAPAAPARPAHALVLGAGFIGIEMAENLRARGLGVTLVQRGDRVLPALDIEMSGPLAERIRAAGVDLRLRTEALAAEGEAGSRVRLSDGTAVETDLVISAIGVRPETDLAERAGLRLGRSGGIWVDAAGRTSAPEIFALGDAAEKTDLILGEPRLVPLAGLANRHGRRIADTVAAELAAAPGAAPGTAGEGLALAPALATAIIGFDGLAAGSLGWNETQLRERGRAVRVIHTHPASHAGYYPGAAQISLKLLVDPDTDAILGAQAVGEDGVDKRLDVIATAVSAGMRASDLADLELAYAPQFGSAKDPVNMLGYVAGNQRAGHDATVQWHELEAAVAAGIPLIDVRGAGQLAEGLIPGAVHVPVEDLRRLEPELPAGELIIHCRVGQGAHTAQRLLAQLGREVRNLDGGYLTWRAGTRAREAARVSSVAGETAPEASPRAVSTTAM